MEREITLKQAQEAVTDGEVSEAGEFFRCVSRSASQHGCHDYIVTLIPRCLPVDRHGGVFVAGEFFDVDFSELKQGLGGFLTLVRTGKFMPPTAENPVPTFLIQHPRVATDIAVHILWDDCNGDLLRDKGGLTGEFAKKYGASWHRRYLLPSCPKEQQGEDIWIVPANGPIHHIRDYLIAQVDHEIAEGDAAVAIRAAKEREYQAHKAKYRQQLEESGLIERFRAAYERDGITLELGENEVIITCPTGIDRIRYDQNLIPTIRESVNSGEFVNYLVDNEAAPKVVTSFLLLEELKHLFG